MGSWILSPPTSLWLGLRAARWGRGQPHITVMGPTCGCGSGRCARMSLGLGSQLLKLRKMSEGDRGGRRGGRGVQEREKGRFLPAISLVLKMAQSAGRRPGHLQHCYISAGPWDA